MPDKAKNDGFIVLLLLISIIIYVLICYTIYRYQHFALFSLFLTVFLCYILIFRLSHSPALVKKVIIGSIIIRLVVLFSTPNLSDDFYRFIWDGRLSDAGINPFSHLPSHYISHPEQAPPGIDLELYENLNSQNRYTIYPPVNQFIFWIAAHFSASVYGGIIMMRIFIILVEIGSILILISMLRRESLPQQNVILYALNPLVILELTGNLHFESFAIFFLLFSLYFLARNKLTLSSLGFGLAICSKLIPVIFYPLLIKRIGWKKTVTYTVYSVFFAALMFTPLSSVDLIKGMQSSISLYFQKFEFNGSLYYLIRQAGYWIKGYNIIQSAGPFLALGAALSILFYSIKEFRKKSNLPTAMMFAYFSYLLWATTVHPWYITPLIAFSILGHFRFALVWSFLVFFTYAGYGVTGFQENLWIVALEYLVVLGYLGLEIYCGRILRLPKWQLF